MKRLGVNIDHVATLRNARGEKHPDPIIAALYVVNCGANSVTIHLREDRRHINDKDAKKICNLKNVLVNLEVSMNERIISSALRIKPNYICIVPENRKEITTEGGLNLKKINRSVVSINFQSFGLLFRCKLIFFCHSLSSILFSDKATYDNLFVLFARCSANSLLPLLVPPVIKII